MSDIKRQASVMLAEEIIRAIKKLTEDNNKTYVNPQLRNYRFTTDNLSADVKKSITELASNIAVDKDAIDKAIDNALADYEVSADKIAGLDALVAEITVLEVQKATIDTAQIENLYATVADFIYMAAEKAEIGDLEAEKITAAIAEMGLANIGSANIDFGQIKDLVTDTAIIREGVGGKLYIDRLAVTDAQILSLTTGELIIQGADGKLYTVYVDENGVVQTALRVVTGTDIDTGTISGDNIAESTITGTLIAEDTITARELNVSKIFADEALIGAIKAANIDVADLSANEAFIALLVTSLIKAPNFGSDIDISKNTSIALTNGRIDLIVESESSETELILTEQMLQAISDHIQLIADTIDLSANTSIRLNIFSSSAPSSPEIDMLWLDTTATPNLLKRWDGSAWVVVNDTSSLENKVTQNTQAIVDLDAEISVTDGKVTALVSQVEMVESEIDGVSTEISEVKTTLTPDGLNAIVQKCEVIEDINGEIGETNQTLAEVSVAADKIHFLVEEGSDESSFSLTDEAVDIISNEINLASNSIIQLLLGAQNEMQRWFTFSDAHGLVIRKPAYTDAEGVVHPASIWQTITDETGYHIKRVDLPGYVGSFARDRLIVDGVETGKIATRKTSSGGWAWVDAE